MQDGPDLATILIPATSHLCQHTTSALQTVTAEMATACTAPQVHAKIGTMHADLSAITPDSHECTAESLDHGRKGAMGPSRAI